MRLSDFRIVAGEKKRSKGARKNPIKGTSGKGTSSRQWREYVKRMTRGNPVING